MGQSNECKIIPVINFASSHNIKDIPIHITMEYSMENDRHYILFQNTNVSDYNKKEWYVYDIEETSLMKIEAVEGCYYIGFSSDSLYGYMENARNLFYRKYPSSEIIILNHGNTPRTDAMRYVAEHNIANGDVEFSINSKGDLAYYNSKRNVLTLILFSKNDSIPKEISGTQGCSHFQWIDTTRLFFSELKVLDEFGSFSFFPKFYDLLDNTITSISMTSYDVSDIYDYYQGSLVLRNDDILKLLDFKNNRVTEYPLPNDFPWIYCIYFLGNNKFLVSAEYHEKDCYPFFILGYD